ncbi:hypothetical protein OH77DRAFT_1400060, partial [Trametes cingulata]
PNFDLLAFQRRRPRGRGCGWACRDASVSVYIRFSAATSKSGLCVEKAARTSGRRRSYS